MKLEWIVPVVVLIVWVVSTILKSRELDEPVRQRQPGGDGRKPSSDIDRFLQEIDRLKRKSAEERGEAAPPPVRPRPVPQVQRVRSVQRPVRLEAVPEVVVVEPVRRDRPVPTSHSVAPTPLPAAARASRAARSAVSRSPAVATALDLLASRRSLAGAILLQEVLGP